MVSLLRSLIVAQAACLCILIAVHGWHIYHHESADGTYWKPLPSELLLVEATAESGNDPFSDLARPGDLLKELQGEPIFSLEQIRRIVKDHGLDESLTAGVYRPADGESRRVAIATSSLSQGRVIEISGVLVTHVFRNGPAQDAGIRPGDLIIEINGQGFRKSPATDPVTRFLVAVSSLGGSDATAALEAQKIVDRLAPGEVATFSVLRGTESHELPVRLGKSGWTLQFEWLLRALVICLIVRGLARLLASAHVEFWTVIEMPLCCIVLALMRRSAIYDRENLMLDLIVGISVALVLTLRIPKLRSLAHWPPPGLSHLFQVWLGEFPQPPWAPTPVAQILGDRAPELAVRFWLGILRIIIIVCLWSYVLYLFSASTTTQAVFFVCLTLFAIYYVLAELRSFHAERHLIAQPLEGSFPDLGPVDASSLTDLLEKLSIEEQGSSSDRTNQTIRDTGEQGNGRGSTPAPRTPRDLSGPSDLEEESRLQQERKRLVKVRQFLRKEN